MKALGVSMVMRKLGAAWKPSVELVKEGDEYILKSTSSVKNTELKFTIGVAVDETTSDNRKVKSTFTWENENKLVQEQVGDPINSTIIREFRADGLVITLKAKDVVCTRTYELEN